MHSAIELPTHPKQNHILEAELWNEVHYSYVAKTKILLPRIARLLCAAKPQVIRTVSYHHGNAQATGRHDRPSSLKVIMNKRMSRAICLTVQFLNIQLNYDLIIFLSG